MSSSSPLPSRHQKWSAVLLSTPLGQPELLRVVFRSKPVEFNRCNHAEVDALIFEHHVPAVLQAAKRPRCDACDISHDLWLCLKCLGVFCSREGNGHGVEHYRESGHCVVLALDSLDFWCHGHETYLEHDFYPSLVSLFKAVHALKHGEAARVADKPRRAGPLTASPSRRVQRLMSVASDVRPPFEKTSSIGDVASLGDADGFATTSLSDAPMHEGSPTLSSTDDDAWINEVDDILMSCRHDDCVARREPNKPVPLISPCMECGQTSENWVCLTCFEVHCSRFHNKHMTEHFSKNPNHAICLSLSDLSIWCQVCQVYLDPAKNSVLLVVYNYFHRLKFKGEILPDPLLLKRSNTLTDGVETSSLTYSDVGAPFSTSFRLPSGFDWDLEPDMNL